MKTAIIIHGRPDKDEYFDSSLPKPVDAHWLSWLKRELEANGYAVQVPGMPVPYEPDYEAWKNVFEQFPVDEETALIGHSRGGGFLLRWLSEHDVKVGQVVLVAPSIMPNPGVVSGFSEYNLDPSIVTKTKGITLFYSTDDEKGILDSVEKIKSIVKDIVIREFTDAGHFTSGDGYDEFPHLLEVILK